MDFIAVNTKLNLSYANTKFKRLKISLCGRHRIIVIKLGKNKKVQFVLCKNGYVRCNTVILANKSESTILFGL